QKAQAKIESLSLDEIRTPTEAVSFHAQAMQALSQAQTALNSADETTQAALLEIRNAQLEVAQKAQAKIESLSLDEIRTPTQAVNFHAQAMQALSQAQTALNSADESTQAALLEIRNAQLEVAQKAQAKIESLSLDEIRTPTQAVNFHAQAMQALNQAQTALDSADETTKAALLEIRDTQLEVAQNAQAKIKSLSLDDIRTPTEAVNFHAQAIQALNQAQTALDNADETTKASLIEIRDAQLEVAQNAQAKIKSLSLDDIRTPTEAVTFHAQAMQALNQAQTAIDSADETTKAALLEIRDAQLEVAQNAQAKIKSLSLDDIRTPTEAVNFHAQAIQALNQAQTALDNADEATKASLLEIRDAQLEVAQNAQAKIKSLSLDDIRTPTEAVNFHAQAMQALSQAQTALDNADETTKASLLEIRDAQLEVAQNAQAKIESLSLDEIRTPSQAINFHTEAVQALQEAQTALDNADASTREELENIRDKQLKIAREAKSKIESLSLEGIDDIGLEDETQRLYDEAKRAGQDSMGALLKVMELMGQRQKDELLGVIDDKVKQSQEEMLRKLEEELSTRDVRINSLEEQMLTKLDKSEFLEFRALYDQFVLDSEAQKDAFIDQLDAVEASQESPEEKAQKIRGIEAKITSLSSRMDQSEAKLLEHENELRRLDGNIGKLQTGLTEKVKSILADEGITRENLDAVQANLNDLEDLVNQKADRVETFSAILTLRDGQQDLERTITSLQRRITDLSGTQRDDVSRLKEHMEDLAQKLESRMGKKLINAKAELEDKMLAGDQQMEGMEERFRLVEDKAQFIDEMRGQLKRQELILEDHTGHIDGLGLAIEERDEVLRAHEDTLSNHNSRLDNLEKQVAISAADSNRGIFNLGIKSPEIARDFCTDFRISSAKKTEFLQFIDTLQSYNRNVGESISRGNAEPVTGGIAFKLDDYALRQSHLIETQSRDLDRLRTTDPGAYRTQLHKCISTVSNVSKFLLVEDMGLLDSWKRYHRLTVAKEINAAFTKARGRHATIPHITEAQAMTMTSNDLKEYLKKNVGDGPGEISRHHYDDLIRSINRAKANDKNRIIGMKRVREGYLALQEQIKYLVSELDEDIPTDIILMLGRELGISPPRARPTPPDSREEEDLE
ncbi:MAG: hypothetical protein ACI8RA_002242, partial [Chlamydiales bacterium]